MTIFGYSIVALILLIAAYFLTLILTMKKISIPTTGNKIVKYQNPQKALLVIDVQEGLSGSLAKPPFKYKDTDEKLHNINRAIGEAVDNDMLVVYIRHEFEDTWFFRVITGGIVNSGRPGADMDSRLNVVNNHQYIKRKSDSFSSSELERFLVSNQVDEIYLAGLDAAICVYNTAKGALNRGYKVTVIQDAIMSIKKLDKTILDYQEYGINLTSSNGLLIHT